MAKIAVPEVATNGLPVPSRASAMASTSFLQVAFAHWVDENNTTGLENLITTALQQLCATARFVAAS